MTDATAAVSPLRRRMIDDMSLRNLSPATQRSYIHAVKRFSRHFGRSPDLLGLEDVRAFQVYLVSQGISWGALNQTVCALRFFYGVILDRAEIPERIVYPDHPGLARAQNLSTTARYMHVATSTIAGTKSPFDRLTLEVVPPNWGLSGIPCVGGHKPHLVDDGPRS